MRPSQDKSPRPDSRTPRRREQRVKFWQPGTPDPREEALWARSTAAGSDWLDEWTLRPPRR
ncbi:MAG: hypothetical protein JO224_02615 [Pelomonas sp.]|nr:hypothetical protein [Roseateles sp.]